MTRSNKKSLIIWDFDGVIADSEKLWVKIWCDILKEEKDITLTSKEKLTLLVGVGDKNVRHNLQKHFPGLTFDDRLLEKISEKQIYMGTHFMEPIPGVQEVLKDRHFVHCIATGATRQQQAWKLAKFKWLLDYIKLKNHFTIDMVQNGKPAPDLFLLAAKTMGYEPKDCVVIEDSIAGIQAAKTAGMRCIAFVGAEGNNTPQYRKKCQNLGVIGVCSTMPELHQFLYQLFK